MRTVSIAEANRVYRCASINEVVHRSKISHELFRAYSSALRVLLRGLGEAASEEIWTPFLKPLRRYGFALCSAPLPFNDPDIQPPAIEKLRARSATISALYPERTIQLNTLIENLSKLRQLTDNPFADWLAEAAARNKGSSAVLVRDSRTVVAAERYLSHQSATRGFSIVTPVQLSKETCFDVLYVLGAAGWFPSFVFDAPRALRTELVSYAWIKDRRVTSKTFLSVAPPVPWKDSDPIQDGETIDATDLLPVIDWRTIGQRITAADSPSPTDSLDARLVLLEGDCGVFLETTDGASVLTIDLEADESTERIARIDTSEVRAGTYLLLRTSGGGDYVVAEADRYFLKERAKAVRDAQRHWKDLLSQEVKKDGLLGVSIRLLDLGSSSAEEINVRNYLSPRSIRTRAPEDFQAIMRLIGLGDKWEDYWKMMEEIDHAHRAAGHRIRRQLLRRLAELDLTELERLGSMEITLPEADAGGFTAFRVLDVSPQSQPVSIHRLNHPFEL